MQWSETFVYNVQENLLSFTEDEETASLDLSNVCRFRPLNEEVPGSILGTTNLGNAVFEICSVLVVPRAAPVVMLLLNI